MSTEEEAANRESYATDLAFEHDLSLPQGRCLAQLALHSLDPTFAPESLAGLADPEVAEAFIASPLGSYANDESVRRVDELAERAIESGFDSAGARYLRACVAEHRGDLDDQRTHLDDALAIDGDFAPALAALGFIAFVEGDVERAARLLARALEHPRTGPMVHTLSHYPPRRSRVGRNARCPCGSGRKCKHCCAGSVAHPLPERAWWLWHKGDEWLRRLAQMSAVVDVACELAVVPDPLVDEDLVVEALDHPLLAPVALFEHGLLARFLERYGALLPDDERELAQQWQSVRHTVWRVEATTPGTSLTLVDLVADRTVEAMNGRVSRCTEPGEVIFAAVVPTGDGWLLPEHPIGLSDAMADKVIAAIRGDADPIDVAARVFCWSIEEPWPAV